MLLNSRRTNEMLELTSLEISLRNAKELAMWESVIKIETKLKKKKMVIEQMVFEI